MLTIFVLPSIAIAPIRDARLMDTHRADGFSRSDESRPDLSPRKKLKTVVF
ncbi:MAG: hypothetical protein J0I91_11155 [Candidatus Accumulibacter sp.]|nr:hypothetical protein [Accumulibacter sp.]